MQSHGWVWAREDLRRFSGPTLRLKQDLLRCEIGLLSDGL